MKPSASTIATFVVVLAGLLLSARHSGTSATAPQNSVIIERCHESQRTYDIESLPNNCRWRIDYRTKGSVWGAEVGGSLEEVVQNSKNTIENQRRLDALYGGNSSASYENPSEPICSVRCSLYSESGQRAMEVAIRVFVDYAARVRSARNKLVRDEFLSWVEGQQIRLKGQGGMLKDYVNALDDAFRQVRNLSAQMRYVEKTGQNVNNLIAATARLENAADRVTTAWNALPGQVRLAINEAQAVPFPPDPRSCDEEVPPPNGRWSILGCYQKCCSLEGAAYDRCQAEQEVWNKKLKACEARKGRN